MGSRSRYGRWLNKKSTWVVTQSVRRRWLMAARDVRCARSPWFTDGWEPEALRRFQAHADRTLEQLVKRS